MSFTVNDFCTTSAAGNGTWLGGTALSSGGAGKEVFRLHGPGPREMGRVECRPIRRRAISCLTERLPEGLGLARHERTTQHREAIQASCQCGERGIQLVLAPFLGQRPRRGLLDVEVGSGDEVPRGLRRAL